MPISTLGLVLIQIGLALLQRLIAPRVPRRKPAPFEAPTVEDGQPITKGFGIFQVSGMVTMVRDSHTTEQSEVTRYWAKIQMAAGFGPVDVLYDIVSDERSLKLAVPSTAQSIDGNELLVVSPELPIPFSGDAPIVVTIAARQLFGGQLSEGGLQGQLRIYPGTDNQPIDPLITVDLGDDASAYPHIIHAIFGAKVGEPSTSGVADDFYWVANTSTPKPILFLFGTYPDALLGDGGRVGNDANGVEMLYACFTDPVWGKGEPTASFDIPQWQAKARQVAGDGSGGLSELFVNRTVADIKDDILSHLDGEVVSDPATGLIQLKLARDDYFVEDLFVVTSANADNLRQGEAQFAQTLNEVKVKYHRFDQGTTGPQSITFLLTGFPNTAPFPLSTSNWSQIRWQSGSRNITNVSATRDRAGVVVTLNRAGPVAPVIAGNDYYVNEATGEFRFFHNVINTTQLQDGDIVTVTFTVTATFSGFVDATATAQNLANRQILGRLRSEAYDYPMFTTEAAAQRKADLLIQTTSRKLAVFQWTMGRAGAHLTPMDVVNFNDTTVFRLTNFPVRITKMTLGTLEHPEITFEGVEDIWGERKALSLINVSAPPPPPPVGMAPDISAVWCAGADIISIQIPDRTYQVEIWRADDIDGTNAALVETVTPSAFIFTWTDPIPGKVHSFRMVRNDVLPGNFTAWLAVCVVGTPGCTEPVITDTPLYDGTTGTLDVGIADPDGRVTEVFFQVTNAICPVSDWVQTVGPPYQATVEMPGTICRRVVYTDCNGVIQSAEQCFDFTVLTEPPPVDPETPVGLTVLDVPVTFQTGSVPLGLRELPAVATPVTAWRGTEKTVPTSGVSAVTLITSIRATTAPVGAFLAVQAEPADSPGTWFYLSEDDGPRLPIDEASLDILDPDPLGAGRTPKVWVVSGESFLLRDEFKGGRVRFRVVIVGGDETSHVVVSECTVWLTSAAPVIPPPEMPEPPPQFPGSCDIPSPLSVTSGWTETAPAGAVFTIDGSDRVLTLDGTGTGPAYESKTYTGLEPNEQYTFYLTVNTTAVAVNAYLEVVGGDTTTALLTGDRVLAARGDANGSGEITVHYGAQEIQNASGTSSSALDYASQAAAEADGWTITFTANDMAITWGDSHAVGGGFTQAVKMTLNGGAWSAAGTFRMEKTFAAVSGLSYHASVYKDALNGPWFESVDFYIENSAGTRAHYSGNGSGSGGQALLTTGNLTATDATIKVVLGKGAGYQINHVNEQYWLAGLSLIGVAGGGAIVRFKNLGSCLGDGVGDGGTGNGDNGTDPFPPPPDGGYPPPPIGGARPFGLFNISAKGLGYWNSTMLALLPGNTVDILNEAAAAGAMNLLKFGGEASWQTGGRFDFNRWKAAVNAITNVPRTMTALQAAIAASAPRPAWAHFVIDEPFHPRWGGISLSTLDLMCQYSKSLFPTWPTVLRLAPNDPRLTRPIVGCDWYWAEYKLSSGNPTQYRDAVIAAADAMNKGVIMGIHYGAFPSPGSSIYITPAQLRYYGAILGSSTSPRVVALHGWKYTAAGYGQAGMPQEVRYVRDLFASFD